MSYVPLEDLLKRCSSTYKLVLLAAKRAKELSEGSPSLITTQKRKVTTVALEEILAGKVAYKTEEPEAGSGKSGRGGKEEKKRAAS